MRKRLHDLKAGLKADLKAALPARPSQQTEDQSSIDGASTSTLTVPALVKLDTPDQTSDGPPALSKASNGQDDKPATTTQIGHKTGHVISDIKSGRSSPETSLQVEDGRVSSDQRDPEHSASNETVALLGKENNNGLSLKKDEWQVASEAVWKQAYDRFVKEQKDLSEFYETFIGVDAGVPPNSDIKTEMRAIVEKQQKHMEERQWTFRAWGMSKPRKVRDAIDGIFSTAKNASGLISLGMTFAPVYVSLPWSAISALIPFIMNDTAQQNGAIQGVEDITRIIHGYNIAEKTYLGMKGAEIDERFADAVLDLYVAILTYQAEVARYFGKRTAINLLTNALQQGVVWKDESASIVNKDKEAQRNLSFLGPGLVEEFFKMQNKKYELLIRAISSQRDRDDDLLKWLYPRPPFEGHFKVAKDLGQRYTSSNKWILHLPEFIDWKSSADGVLLLEGSVGTGKSSITFSVIEDSLKNPGGGHLAFFYCSKSTGVDQDLTLSILKSFLRQCATNVEEGSIHSTIREFHDDNKERCPEKCDLGSEECFPQLKDIVNASRHLTIVIDALDECQDLDDLLSNIEELRREAGDKLRIFLTSRYGLADTVRSYLPDAKRLEILDQNSADIEEYLKQEIPVEMEARRVGNAMTDEQANRLKEMLKSRARGMFLWVTLQVGVFLPQDRRARPKTVEDVESRLKALEASGADLHERLSSAYDQVYKIAIGPADQSRRKAMVDTALKWVLCSYRPVNISELCYAVAIGPDGVLNESIKNGDDVLLEVCSNLLTKDPSGVIRLSHLSVKEYFQGRKSITESSGPFDVINCHAQVALTCLHYKCLNVPRESSQASRTQHEFSVTANDINAIGLPTYAVTYWSKHYKNAGRNESKALEESSLFRLLIKFLESRPDGPRRMQILNLGNNDNLQDIPGPVFTLEDKLRKAARLGWEDEVESLIALGASIYGQNAYGDTVLHEAVDWGRADVVEIILGNADVRDPDLLSIANASGNTVLHASVFWGRKDVLRVMADRSSFFAPLNINSMSPLDVSNMEKHLEADQVSPAPSDSTRVSAIWDQKKVFFAGASLTTEHGRYIYEESNTPYIQNTETKTEFKDLYLETSASCGCKLCALFVQEFIRRGYFFDDRDETSSYVSVKLSLANVPWSSTGSRDLLTVLVGENAKVVLELHIDSDNAPTRGTYEDLSGRSIARVSHSEECFSLAKSWLDGCQKSHTKCQANLESRLPTRVVCFDDSSDDDDFHLRLRNSEVDERGAYVYLSYAWGGLQPLITKESNMSDFTKGIPLETIPVTWRDAFVLVRQLGIKYLWIDALCIVQDSQEDWAREASQIGDYVSNAAIVLAAGFGANPSTGLFTSRQTEDLTWLVYTGVKAGGHSSSGVVRFRRPLEETREAILKTPLAQRAWTMQETVLPERLLYYGSEQLYWNCQEYALAEGSTFPERPIWDLASQMRALSTQPTSNISPLLLNPWYGLVQEYSARVLVYRGDKFPAIESIARAFEASGGNYFAGLWKNDMHRGLLWNVTKLAKAERPEYIAPSWSWASLDVPVNYEVMKGIRLPIDSRSSANIIDITVESSSFHSFGRVKSGHLILSGLAQEVNEDLKLSSSTYLFDTRRGRDLWEAKASFTSVLIARWAHGLTNRGSQWVGLILSKLENQDNTYVREGLLIGPMYEDKMLGWERRTLKIV
ncbi:uncharacterized protein BP5553_10466 [Venustampulla echinocandica]|uniref:Uncharacterized protein n=1 Tax=Venustampulla echinocandica TaxID=2656787 RepID=A0A370T9E5_9HELO|nr:uncharacterized protein BP5553_10466 [Venustampulla echinocandica]RDL30188.1 hypothetical protein BP5553_10466 [Venustampulla echinocandica]